MDQIARTPSARNLNSVGRNDSTSDNVHIHELISWCQQKEKCDTIERSKDMNENVQIRGSYYNHRKSLSLTQQ